MKVIFEAEVTTNRKVDPDEGGVRSDVQYRENDGIFGKKTFSIPGQFPLGKKVYVIITDENPSTLHEGPPDDIINSEGFDEPPDVDAVA